MKLKKNLKAPLLILSIGIAILGSSLVIGYWYKWTPASFPVDLRPGITRSPLFSVDLTTDYVIEFEVERNLPFEQLICLLGDKDAIALKKCEATASLVDFRWRVFSLSGEPVAQGASAQEHGGAASNTFMSRYIGRFQGESGKEYLVEVELLKDASLLMPSHPHINVKAHTTVQKEHYVISGIGMTIGLMFAIPSLLWLAVRMFASKTAGSKKR